MIPTSLSSRFSLSKRPSTRLNSSDNLHELTLFEAAQTKTTAKDSAQPSPCPSLAATSDETIEHATSITVFSPGRTGWLQVIVGFLVNFNTFGIIQSFGIFQPHYEVLLDSTPSTVAWIGSIHIFFVYFLGSFSGWLLDRGFYRSCLITGSCLQIVGLLVAGFSHNWWLSFPTVTMIGMYFQNSGMKTTTRSLAGCGGATGGMVFPTIAHYTIKSLSLSWTVWIMCAVVLFTSVLIQIFAQPKPLSSTATADTTPKGRIFEWRAFQEPSYTLYVTAIFFNFSGLWIPYFYIRVYSASALHITSAQSFAVMLVLNGLGIPGRILPALLADKVLGTVNTYILIIFSTSVALLCWPLVASVTSLVPWAMVYGFCAGGGTFLMQAGVASLTRGRRKRE
jgi:MFS family permease